jgi:hypothetical protein
MDEERPVERHRGAVVKMRVGEDSKRMEPKLSLRGPWTVTLHRSLVKDPEVVADEKCL